MGTTFAGDIPSGAFGVGVISNAVLASNGAAATYGGAGAAEKWRAPQNLTIVDAWWEPSGADNAATSLTSYRLVKLVQGSTDATGTVVLGSVAMSATLASDTQRAMTLATTPTVSKGYVVMAAQISVGGNHSVGTVTAEGQTRFTFRPI